MFLGSLGTFESFEVAKLHPAFGSAVARLELARLSGLKACGHELKQMAKEALLYFGFLVFQKILLNLFPMFGSEVAL